MTPETRTIDLSALATELEAAGWEVTASCSYLMAFSNHGREIWAYAGCIDFWQEDEDANTVSIVLPDPVWQTALGIVQRHIAGGRA